MARIVLLSGDLLERMVMDPAFQQFPCLATPPRKAAPAFKKVPARGCGGCKRKNKKVKVRARANKPGPIDHNLLKQQIAQLPRKDQEAIKTLLDCTGLKVQYRGSKKAGKKGVERRVL